MQRNIGCLSKLSIRVASTRSLTKRHAQPQAIVPSLVTAFLALFLRHLTAAATRR